jgi:hypothetical protein
MNRSARRVGPYVAVALGALVLASLGPGKPRAAPADYPTEALADYVFGCMATNGQSQDALRRCACSIDAIAAKVSYDDYVKAETVLLRLMLRSLTESDRLPAGRLPLPDFR